MIMIIIIIIIIINNNNNNNNNNNYNNHYNNNDEYVYLASRCDASQCPPDRLVQSITGVAVQLHL